MGRVRSLLATAAVVTGLGVLSGCTVTITGTPSAGDGVTFGDADTGILRGGDGGPIDQLAAAAITDVQDYWRQTFEPTFGKEWTDIEAFYSVDTTDSSAKPPPCTESATDVEGNAFYCPSADIIAFDRSALLPVLVEQFGDAGVVVVLAHEIGHAVHNRLGIDNAAQRAQPQLYPTIVVESMADCYAGTFLRWVSEEKAAHLRVSTEQLDAALGSLVSFRDPLGTSSGDRGAHGNAFDRVSSFQDGFQQGPEFCSKITGENRPFTLRAFTDLDDEANQGNLPLPALVEAITGDLDDYYGKLVTAAGGTWTAPTLETDPSCSGNQGPVAFCPEDRSVAFDPESSELARLHRIGDYATGTLLSTRYGLAVLAALGRSTEGDTAADAALCLAGSYTGDLLSRETGFGLSPGDLDEAVLVLLRYDYAVRDDEGDPAPGSGFERVDRYREGTLEGASSCDLG